MSLELIFKDKKFWPLFWTQFMGALNDNLFKNALVMLITYRGIKVLGMSPEQFVPLAGGVFIFPYFIFSATAGQIADKFEKSKLIRITKVLELGIMSVAALGFYFDLYGLLLFVLFLMGTQSAFFGPLKYGIIPSIVPKDKLVLGTAYVSSGSFIAILVGTLLGGSTVELMYPKLGISIGILSFALFGLLFSFFVKPVEIHEEKAKVDYTFFKPTWKILRLTMKKKEIFRAVLGVSWFWFLGASILSLLPVFVKNTLSGNSAVATIFLSLFTIGMGIGSFLTEKLSFKRVEMGMIPLSALGMSLFLIELFFVGSQWPKEEALLTLGEFFENPLAIRVSFDLLVVSIFGGAYIVPQIAFVQERSKASEISQTIAGNNIWNALFMVSAALFIMLLSSYGSPKLFLLLGLINLVVSFMLYVIYSEQTLRFLCWAISKALYNVEVRGVENFPENGACIVVSNHVSFVDWLLIMCASPRPVRFIIDWNYYYFPTGPFWLRQARLIPIATRRESPEVLEKAFKTISNNLKEGAVLGIFPEGWVTRDGQMRKFQPGINKILKEDTVPIVPISLDGLWGSILSFERGKILFKWPKKLRRKIKVTIHPVIAGKDYDQKETQNIIASAVEHYKGLK